MNFTPQQMAGYKGYSGGVLIGNWYEDTQVKEDKLRAFQAATEGGGIDPVVLMNTPVMLQPAQKDGFVRFDSALELKNLLQGAGNSLSLAVDTSPKRRPRLNHYFISLVDSSNTPIARTVWLLKKATDAANTVFDSRGEGDVLHYGQLFRIVNEFSSRDGFLHLCSEKASATSHSRGKKQLVTACLGVTNDCNFVLESVGNVASDGDPVRVGDRVVIRHAMTHTPLFADSATKVIGLSGPEIEVSGFMAKAQATKVQTPQLPANFWTFEVGAPGAVYKPPRFAITPSELIDRLKNAIMARAGGMGFHGVARSLRAADKHGSSTLNRRELRQGLEDYGVVATTSELDSVFKVFDRNGNNTISIADFIRELRGPLPARRELLVREAFRCIDKDGSGVVTFDELREAYARSLPHHPDVINGAKREEHVLKEFLAMWDKTGTAAKVTLEEFIDYYTDISCSISNDDYFELMIRNAWHMSGGKGWAENTTCKRVLVVHTDGTQEVVELTNDLGLDVHDMTAVKEKLAAQGVQNIKRVELAD